MFETKVDSYEDISWASVWNSVSLWVLNKRKFSWRYSLSQFEVIYVYEFQTKPNSYEDICWVSVWSYISLWVSNKSDFLLRLLVSVRLKFCKFMSFKQKRILMKIFVESQFEVMEIFEFQTKANSYEDICWVSVSSYISLWVSNKSDFLWRLLLSVKLELSKFMSFRQKRILLKTFLESQFEVM